MTTRKPASASAQGSAAAAAHLTTSRMKTDAEFYDSLEYDRTRYTEDIAVAARVFLLAVRNALRCDPLVGDLDTTSVGRADLPLKDKNKAASAAAATTPAPAVVTSSGTGTASASASAPASTSKAVTSSSAAAAAAHAATQPAVAAPRTSSGSNNNADRKNNATPSQADGTARGTKRPAPGPPSRNGNASSQKQKKTKRSPSTSNNAGSAAADAANTSGGSDGSNGRSTTAAASHNSANAINGNGSGGGGGNTSIPARSDVACKVKEDGKVSWILAKVSRYVSELKKYEVTDSGDDERVKKHMVFKKNIRVLPKKPFDFENKQRVLAVYPDTTVFYPATVTGRRGKHIQCLFDDEEDMMYPTKEVDARFVIHPESG